MTHTAFFGRGATLWLALAPLAVALNTAPAQSAGELGAYTALIYTPVAGLPPLPPSADSLGPASASRVTIQGRMGHMSRRGGLSIDTYGVGLELPRGRARFGATLAYLSASCGEEWEGDPDCEGDIMLGGSVRTMLTSRPLGAGTPPPKARRGARTRASNQNRLLVGFDGSVGFSPRQGEQAIAVAAGLPTGVMITSGEMRILPFLTPGLGYGRMGNVEYFDDEAPTAHGGMAFMLGGGFGLEFGTSGLRASVGFQKVFKSNGGTTQLGLGLTWNGVTAAR